MVPIMRLLVSVWAIALGVFAGAVLLFVGPRQDVVCGEAGWPASIVQDWRSFGQHTDGATANLCSVPHGWVVYLAVFPLLVAIVLVAAFWISVLR
ncbi:MAG: hypothetical protein AAGG08_19305 [Actinomycetota bacterium]